MNLLKVLKIVDAQLTFDKFDQSFLKQLPANLEHLEIVLFRNHMSDINRIKFPLSKFVNLKILRFVGFNDSIVDWKSSLQSIPFPGLIETLDLTNCFLDNIESFFLPKSGKYRFKELHLGKSLKSKNHSLKNKEGVRNCFPAMLFANRTQFDSIKLDISSI